jgi:lipoprotein NlpD
LPVVEVTAGGAKKLGTTPSSSSKPVKEMPVLVIPSQDRSSIAASTSTAVKNVPVFAWPYNGHVSVRFRDNNSKGIVIEKSSEDQVLGVADGKVLYAGSGLRGYGNLLIIKHNEQWLSAYAHNKRLLVKEGQNVKQGQAVALIGQSEAPRPVAMLHFELRYLGKPVDPLLYLPAR